MICGVATADSLAVLLYVGTPRRELEVITVGACREALSFERIFCDCPDWSMAFVYLRHSPFSTELPLEYSGQPIFHQMVEVQIFNQHPGRIVATYITVGVNEERRGSLPIGEDPLYVFQSLRKAFKKLEVPGTFRLEVDGVVSGKIATGYHWTDAVRSRYLDGATLFEHKVRVLADTD